MIDVEKALFEKKDELEMLEIPDNMEQKLRDALSKNSSRLPTRWIAVALVIVLIFSYSFDTLAYYGKKFTGYDEVMNGSIKKLNEDGRGQDINKSCVFSNGIEVTLTGILFDDKELLAFIKMHSTKDKLASHLPLYNLKGIKPLGYNMKSGQGTFIDDYTVVFTQSFEAPKFYEKWMKLDIIYVNSGRSEVKSIAFTLNRNKAIKQEIKKDIDKQVQIGDYYIKFDSISASGMSTNINGKIIPLNDNAAKVFTEINDFKEFEAPRLVFDIIANGDKVIPAAGAQRSSSGGDIAFTNGSEALPEELRTLQLKNIRLEYLKFIDKESDITPRTINMKICDDLIIKKVELEGDTLNVTISSKGIPIIGVFEGETQVEQINSDEFKYEGRNDQLIDRVYKFKGNRENMKLHVKCIRYSEITDKTIDIPVD